MTTQSPVPASVPALGSTGPAITPAPASAARRPVTGVRGTGHIARIVLDWPPMGWDTVVDHYAVHAVRAGSRRRDVPITDETLLAKTVYPHLVHDGLGGAAARWIYRIVTVDAAGRRSRASRPTAVTSLESVTVSGTPLAVVGDFDSRGLELALSPAGYAQYTSTFPDGVDVHAGDADARTRWSYLHPGPADSWAGRRTHTFRLRFDLAEVPAGDVDLALWLIDSHATRAGSAVLSVNGTQVDRVTFEGGATKGSTQGDATVAGSPLKPSFVERPLARNLFVAGENVLELVKDDGSWIAYDAIGVFARTAG